MNAFISGLLTVTIIYAGITLLHYMLPGRWVKGYVKGEDGNKLRYKLNGLIVLILSIATWFLLGFFDIVSWDWLYTVRYGAVAGAFLIGLIFSFVLVLPNKSTGRSLFADIYFGRLDNPQLQDGKIDAKMWLYLIGAVMLELNVLSYAAHHYLTFGTDSSPGIFLSAALLTWFVFDYLTFEEVHLYTYDFFAEKVGFKLGWGCLTFYPFFYAIGLFTTASRPSPGTPTWLLFVFAGVFFTGWMLARGANMQKFFFKTKPEKSFMGIEPQTISDGEKSLLVSGFWGLSRHINYLGEILMATGITLALGYYGSPWPWLYPLYYVLLLFPRQYFDDKRCAEKYGDLWDEYKKKVKFRIIPFLY